MEDSKDCHQPRPAPEIAIEWRDVEIEIKYCGSDSTAQEENYVSLFPSLNPALVSSEDLDLRKEDGKKGKKKQLKEYEKFVCHFCSKGFYRKSSLHNHLLYHVRSKALT